ncbi:MAG: hypothetical protein ABL929_07405, partial [Ferruginibacter sp.]
KLNTKEFVISYAISITGEKTDGIAQTYNGGLKTVFIKNDLVRLRLVSLMRVQSIYFNNKIGLKTKVATVTKESGKEKAKMYLNSKEWKIYNKKNDSSRCDIFIEDTTRILNILCTKAIITLKDSTILTVYYLPNFNSKNLKAAEPLFNKIPGIPLKYTYTINNKTIEYTAVNFKSAPILQKVFSIPGKGYITQKYKPGASTSIENLNADDADDEGTEEEENENVAPIVTPVKTP